MGLEKVRTPVSETGLLNRFVEPFVVEVDYWERALSTVGEILEMVLSVQKGYMYLDNIFGAEDIRRQLPAESDEFDRLTAAWREITGRMAASGLALDATHQPRKFPPFCLPSHFFFACPIFRYYTVHPLFSNLSA